MAIRCGHCGGLHERAADVRACFEVSKRTATTATPTPVRTTTTDPAPVNSKRKKKPKKKRPALTPVWNNPPKGGPPQPTVKAKKVPRPNEGAPKSRTERAAEAKKATPSFDKRDKYD